MFLNFTFSRNILRFSSAKISDVLSFLVIDHKFRISPISEFPPPIFLFQCIFPCFARKLLFSPYFYKFTPCFRKINLLFNTLCVFRFPSALTMIVYASPNARTGRPWTQKSSTYYLIIIICRTPLKKLINLI